MPGVKKDISYIYILYVCFFSISKLQVRPGKLTVQLRPLNKWFAKKTVTRFWSLMSQHERSQDGPSGKLT